jgi:hypothetical protein
MEERGEPPKQLTQAGPPRPVGPPKRKHIREAIFLDSFLQIEGGQLSQNVFDFVLDVVCR